VVEGAFVLTHLLTAALLRVRNWVGEDAGGLSEPPLTVILFRLRPGTCQEDGESR